MSRLRSSLRFAATAALCVAVTLGLISHLRGALFGYLAPRVSCYVRSEYGRLIIHAHQTDPCDIQGWRAATWPHVEPALSPGMGGWWDYGGFRYARGGTTIGITVHQLAIPYWSLALAALVVRLLCHAPRDVSHDHAPRKRFAQPRGVATRRLQSGQENADKIRLGARVAPIGPFAAWRFRPIAGWLPRRRTTGR